MKRVKVFFLLVFSSFSFATEPDIVGFNPSTQVYGYGERSIASLQPHPDADITFHNHGPNQQAIDAFKKNIDPRQFPCTPKNGKNFVVDHAACNSTGAGCAQSQALFDHIARVTGYPVLGRNTPRGFVSWGNNMVVQVDTYLWLQQFRKDPENVYDQIKANYGRAWREHTQKQFQLPVLNEAENIIPCSQGTGVKSLQRVGALAKGAQLTLGAASRFRAGSSGFWDAAAPGIRRGIEKEMLRRAIKQNDARGIKVWQEAYDKSNAEIEADLLKQEEATNGMSIYLPNIGIYIPDGE